MKLITRNVDYAIRALCVIASGNNDVVSVSDLVKKTQIPRPFLRRILQILGRQRIVKSFKGKGGGFSLTVAPDKLHLVDLISIFQGSVKINECTFKSKICPNIRNCRFRKKLESIQDYIIGELGEITLGCLIGKGGLNNVRAKYYKN